MRPDGELRLFAVPMCGGLVSACANAVTQGISASALFEGFLFGCVIATVLGIPLLLWGDRRCPQSKTRHLLSALIQSLLANLLLGLPLVTLVFSTLALGLLYSLVLLGIQRLPPGPLAAQRSPGSVVAVPLSGGLTLGVAAVVLVGPGASDSLSAFWLGFLIGGLLSMLVCWPILWLIERFLNTPWRYVLGGGVSGSLIWLMIGLPNFIDYLQTAAPAVYLWPPAFWQGALLFTAFGLAAGALCTLINRVCEWRHRQRNAAQLSRDRLSDK